MRPVRYIRLDGIGEFLTDDKSRAFLTLVSSILRSLHRTSTLSRNSWYFLSSSSLLDSLGIVVVVLGSLLWRGVSGGEGHLFPVDCRWRVLGIEKAIHEEHCKK